MLNKPALSKIERKSLLRAGHCARLFERSVGVIFSCTATRSEFRSTLLETDRIEVTSDVRLSARYMRHEQKNRATIFVCAEFFASFCRYRKKRKERLEEE